MQFLDSTGVSSLMTLIKNALANYKPKQTAKSDPTANGTSTTFIATASQDADGVITVTKKTVPTVVASTNGSGGNAGMMTAAQAEKLAGIAAGAQVNTITGVKGDGESSYRTGNVNITKSNIGLGNVGNFKAVSTVATQGLTDAEKSNARDNIGAGTSSLVIGTTSGTAADGKTVADHVGNTSNPHGVTKSQVGLGNVTNDAQVKRAEMGVAGGVATLGSDGKVPSSQLPSYVDDVIEGYYKSSDGKFYTTKSGSTYSDLITGEAGKVYVDKDTNQTFRCSNVTDQTFVPIKGDLALGETSSTAYRGDRGKTAYDHSQSTHARTDATAVTASTTNGNIKINGTETTVYTHPSGTNPHGTTKADVGLGNVGNFKAVSTVASQGLTDTEKSNARANIGAGTSSLVIGTTSGTAADGKTVADHIGNTTAHITSAERTNWNNKTFISGAVNVDEIMASDGETGLVGTGKTIDDLALANHTHGNINNGGALQNNPVTIDSGDRLVVMDASNSNKVASASVSFDGSTTSKALTPKGTFETFLQSHQDISGKADKSATVSNVAYDTTNKKLTKTINGTTSDVVTAATIVTDGGGLKSHQTIKQDGITGATANRYAVCSTAAGTAAKTASVTGGTPTLEAGLHVFVKFANTNTAASPTLNINSTGTKAIHYDGTAITTEATAYGLLTGLCEFVYDGTQWNLIGKMQPLSDQDLAELWAAA